MPDEQAAPIRNSERASVSEAVKIAVWAKAAGRCAMCADYLVGGEGFVHTTLVGELAHNVGATAGARSPRGQSELTREERALETNLVLLCHACHRKVDSAAMAQYYSEPVMAAIKNRHEARVRAATDFATLEPAFVLRLGSNVRGTFALATDRQVAEAFLESGLTAGTDDSRDAIVDVDLPDPETWATTWERSKQLIDDAVSKVSRDMRAASVGLLAVFALAPIPTLAYLGHALDDKGAVRAFPPSRRDSDDRWSWASDPASPPVFGATVEGAPGAAEIVMTVNITAEVRDLAIPGALRGLPRVDFRTVDIAPSPLLFESRSSTDAFARAWRQTMADIEGAFPAIERVHVIAAIPAVGALEIGRAHMRSAQPKLVMYQRHGDSYEEALSIG